MSFIGEINLTRYLLAWILLVLCSFALILLADDAPKLLKLASSGVGTEGVITTVNQDPPDSRSFVTFSYSWQGNTYSGEAGGAKGREVGGSVLVTVDPVNPKSYVLGDARRKRDDMWVWATIQSVFLATALVAAWLIRRGLVRRFRKR